MLKNDLKNTEKSITFEKSGRGRRQLKRISFFREVEIVGGIRVQSTQLGLGGMFLETTNEFPVGSLLPLRFKLSENDSEPIQLKARVLYAEPGVGIGIEFKNLPWKLLTKISDFIEDK